MPAQPTPETHQHWWTRVDRYLHRNRAIALATKIVVTTIGSLVLAAGLIMMVTPGPGLVGIVAGLAILATEWEWAERWVQAARRKLHEARESAEAMDPAVRRRRILLASLAVVVVASIVVTYLVLEGWPGWIVAGWDRMQSVFGFVPDLPGM